MAVEECERCFCGHDAFRMRKVIADVLTRDGNVKRLWIGSVHTCALCGHVYRQSFGTWLWRYGIDLEGNVFQYGEADNPHLKGV